MPLLQGSRLVLAVGAAVGVSIMGMGALGPTFFPHFQLDATITPEELADPATHEAALASLRQAGAGEWNIWCMAGLAMAVAAGVGLFALFRVHAREAEPPAR